DLRGRPGGFRRDSCATSQGRISRHFGGKFSTRAVAESWITRCGTRRRRRVFSRLDRFAYSVGTGSRVDPLIESVRFARRQHAGGLAMAEPLSELLERQVARWTDRTGDWDAFADARVDGYRRAQHRFIGYRASGQTDGGRIQD